MYYASGEILVFGDIHFSDVFEGKHVDYLTNCFGVMGRLVSMVQERKPKAVVILGDLVGWNETNIKSREVLSKFVECFQLMAEVSDIYVLRGNHDLNGYPDYDFLRKIGLIKYEPYIDYGGTLEMPDVRFHLINFGDEYRELDIYADGSNVVFAHNNFTIDGVTTWYADHIGITLNLHRPFDDVDLVVSGHIHTPSPELVSVALPSGKDCALFYPGCPTRPIKTSAERYDYVWAVAFEYKNGVTDYNMIPIELTPWDELFIEDDIAEVSDEELAELVRKEQLADVLQDIIKYRLTGGDLIAQVDAIPNASDEARVIAKDYLRIAQGGN